MHTQNRQIFFSTTSGWQSNWKRMSCAQCSITAERRRFLGQLQLFIIVNIQNRSPRFDRHLIIIKYKSIEISSSLAPRSLFGKYMRVFIVCPMHMLLTFDFYTREPVAQPQQNRPPRSNRLQLFMSYRAALKQRPARHMRTIDDHFLILFASSLSFWTVLIDSRCRTSPKTTDFACAARLRV